MKALKIFAAIFFLIFNSLYSNQTHSNLNIANKHAEITVNRKFVVFVTSFNNENFCEKNLQSIIDQTYQNYRVIYVDDASTDRTNLFVNNFIEQSGLKDKFTIIKNTINVKAIANLYKIINESCFDDEIIVNLDGDDFFSHSDVLRDLNAYYQSDDVWMTWGSYISWSTGKKGEHALPVPKKVLKEGKIRKYGYCQSHLKTFYAKLFKAIKKEDFLVDGEFPWKSPDLFMMFPLIELAGLHAFYIPDVFYIYNDINPISERYFQDLRYYLKVVNYTHSLKPYPPILSRDW